MKVTKLVKNPIHAGSLYLDKEITILEDVSDSDRAALLQYEATGSIRIETVDAVPEVRQRIQEATGVLDETPVPRPATKKRSRRRSE